MMNDMMITIEETLTPDIAAQIEHEEWQRKCEGEDLWAGHEAAHGPLMSREAWLEHCSDLSAWFDQGVMK